MGGGVGGWGEASSVLQGRWHGRHDMMKGEVGGSSEGGGKTGEGVGGRRKEKRGESKKEGGSKKDERGVRGEGRQKRGPCMREEEEVMWGSARRGRKKEAPFLGRGA